MLHACVCLDGAPNEQGVYPRCEKYLVGTIPVEPAPATSLRGGKSTAELSSPDRQLRCF